MKLFRGAGHIFILTLLVIQILGKKITLYVGETVYEYDENDSLGNGSSGATYKGMRSEGDKIDFVAFKVALQPGANLYLEHERRIYETIGEHESIPKYYHHFSRTNERESILVTEFLGDTVIDLLLKLEQISVVTIVKIGLQVLDAIEYLHKEKHVIHFDLHPGNWAVGFNNDSKIYIFDFDRSEEFEMIGDSIELKNPFNVVTKHNSCPQRDLELLSNNLYFLLLLSAPRNNYKMYRNVEFQEVLTEYFNNLRELNQPYEKLRNILQTELEEHKNQPNFNKFEWQM